jgi:hypothetical protein
MKSRKENVLDGKEAFAVCTHGLPLELTAISCASRIWTWTKADSAPRWKNTELPLAVEKRWALWVVKMLICS